MTHRILRSRSGGKMIRFDDLQKSEVLHAASVCIAAHNEETSISKTIESILSQEWRDEVAVEVIVCANACTDKTAERVRQISSPRIPIVCLETSTKGKPNAWNELVSAASSNVLYFVDADVVVDRQGFQRIYDVLRSRSDLVAVAGTNAAIMRQQSLLTRLSVPPARNGILKRESQAFICGRLYAFRKRELLTLMRDVGYSQIPPEILHEDAWIQRMLDVAVSRRDHVSLEDLIRGDGRVWGVCRDAYAYFIPHDWKEDPRLKARAMHSREQLRAYFPEYYAALDRVHAHRSRDPGGRGLRKLAGITSAGPISGPRELIRRTMQKWAFRKARSIYEANKANAIEVSAQHWIRSEASRSSKEPSVPL